MRRDRFSQTMDDVSIIDCGFEPKNAQPGDEIEVGVTVLNNASTDADVGVIWSLGGADMISQSGTVRAGERRNLRNTISYDYAESIHGRGDFDLSVRLAQVGEAQAIRASGCDLCEEDFY